MVCMVDFPLQCLSTARMIRCTWGRPRSAVPAADWIAWISAVLFVLAETAVVNIILMLALASKWKNQGVLLAISWV